MPTRHAKLFRNGRNQAIRIPKEFEIDDDEVTIRKEGDKLIIEPVNKRGLLAILSALKPINDSFPDIDEDLPPFDDVNI